MKDAKGHGSDAHSSGVQQVGQPKTYSWVKYGNGHQLTHGGPGASIATVDPHTDSGGKRQYIAQYDLRADPPPGLGNKLTGWMMHGTPQGGKKWVEGELAKFWEPPKVKSK